MRIITELWPVSEIIDIRSRIEEQPSFQRGPVWSNLKRYLLLDSILRGLDVPKIYLHRLPSNAMYDYQIIDGQQRLTTLWLYILERSLALSLPPDLEDARWHGKKFDALSASDKKKLKEWI